MRQHLEVISAIGLGLGLAMALVPGAVAQQNSVTAIDIALEPDATMVQHAMAANARLLMSFPKGFALDETHHPHVSMLQQFVRTDDLEKIYAAAKAVFDKEKPRSMGAEGVQILLYPLSADRPRGDRCRTNGRPASAARRAHQSRRALCGQDRDRRGFLQRRRRTRHPGPFLISYVENFVRDAAGKRFNPHVTIGVGTEKYLNEMLAEPFPSFTFSPAGASVYQLGTFGTARKELKALTL